MALGVGQLMELCSVNGIVLTDIDIVRFFRDIEIGAVRNVAEGLVFGRSDCYGITVFSGFLISLLGPLAGNDIGCHMVAHEVHGNRRKLCPGAALQEQYLIVVRNVQDITKILFRLFDDAVVNLAAVAHLHDRHAAASVVEHFIGRLAEDFLRENCHDRHAAASVVEHFIGRLAEDFLRENCGTCGKIVNSIHF